MAGTVDNYFGKINAWIGKSISNLAAFLFLLFSVGALYGVLFGTQNILFLIAPPVLGILAYYNRTFAVIALVLIGIFFLL